MTREWVLIVGYSNAAPEDAIDGELIMLDTGFEEYGGMSTIPNEALAYITTFAHKNGDVAAALDEIREAWLGWTGEMIQLEVLTTDPDHMCKSQRQSFEELDDGNWSYKPPVVFCRGNSVALEEARDFVIECALKRKWKKKH